MGSTITQKGQVTIPKKWRDEFGLHPGMAVDFSRNKQNQLVMNPKLAPKPQKSKYPKKLEDWAGYAKTVWGNKTTDEIMLEIRGDYSDDPGFQ